MTALYHYTARDESGEFLRGSVEAASDQHALASLRARSLFVITLEGAATWRGSLLSATTARLSRTELSAFFRCFSTLIACGIGMRAALEITGEECRNRRLREALNGVAGDIEDGLSLSDALQRRPSEFAQLWIAMIRAGEHGGVLDMVLDTIAKTLERERALRSKIASALIYPCIVAVAALALVAFLLTSIVPAFQTEYQQFHVPVPAITRMLIAMGELLRSPRMLWVLAAAVPASLACRSPHLRRTAARAAGRMSSRIPAVASLIRKIAQARLARLLHALLAAGVGISPALELAAGAVGSQRYRDALFALKEALDRGDAIAGKLAESSLFDAIFVQMIRVGEETGKLDAMLSRLADVYESEAESALSALAAFIEPALILVVGAGVGVIVSAVFIPLYSLIGSLK